MFLCVGYFLNCFVIYFHTTIQVADCSFEFCVKEESDSGLGGKWHEDDTEMSPWRRVLVFPSSKLDEAINRVSAMLQQ